MNGPESIQRRRSPAGQVAKRDIAKYDERGQPFLLRNPTP